MGSFCVSNGGVATPNAAGSASGVVLVGKCSHSGWHSSEGLVSILCMPGRARQFVLGGTNGCVADAIWVICQLRVRVRDFKPAWIHPLKPIIPYVKLK